MPDKITSKNLSFERSVPPFLAALRGEYSAARSDGPDPLLAGQRRVAQPRSGSAEAEDAPVVLDEEGNVVSGVRVGVDGAVKEVDAAGEQAGKEDEINKGTRESDAAKELEEKQNEKVAAIGGGKKRKLGRVVGEQAVDGREDSNEQRKAGAKDGPKPNPSGRTDVKKTTKAPPSSHDSTASSGPRVKKKAKKIALSFGDD